MGTGQPASRAINLSRAMWPYGRCNCHCSFGYHNLPSPSQMCSAHAVAPSGQKILPRALLQRSWTAITLLHCATPYALNPPLSLNAPSNFQPVQYVRSNEHPRPLREATWHLLGNFSHRPIATTISPLFNTSLSRVSGYSRKYPCRKRQYLPASIPQKFSCWQPVS